MAQKTLIIVAVIVVILIIALILGLVLFRRRSPPATPPAPAPPTPATPPAPAPAPAPATPPPKFQPSTQWACYTDVLTPVNVNANGNIQCLSNNSIDCLWPTSNDSAYNKTYCDAIANTANTGSQANLQSVICTSDQYLNPTHWCYLSRKYYTPVA